jgi:hypothetical protein
LNWYLCSAATSALGAATTSGEEATASAIVEVVFWCLGLVCCFPVESSVLLKVLGK